MSLLLPRSLPLTLPLLTRTLQATVHTSRPYLRPIPIPTHHYRSMSAEHPAKKINMSTIKIGTHK